MLKSYSLVPTVVSPSVSLFSLKMLIGYAQNSPIERLSGMGFNIYPSLVVDILHEFDLEGESCGACSLRCGVVYQVDHD